MYDVAIIGLGPAGATLARLLDPGLRVIAIDRKNPDGSAGFQKPCGGLLSTDAQKALSRFNLTLPLDLLVDPQIFSVRTIDLGSGIIRHYQRFYINLDRRRFDQWLISLIPGRVEVRHRARCTQVCRVEDGYEVTWREDGTEHIIRAKCLVGADGASSVVRRYAYPEESIRKYLAIQQWFPDAHATPFYSCVFDRQTTDCYAWGLSKNGSFLFGGAFAVKTGREDFKRLKERLGPYGFRLEHPLRTEACMVLRPAGPGDYCCGRDGMFLIGEAAGFVSPSSLEGISYAINSGYALSRVLNQPQGNPNRRYRRAVADIRTRLTLKNLKSPFLYAPPLRRMVMKSGLNAIQVLEDEKPAPPPEEE